MRYPIDPQTVETFLGHLVEHERAQRHLMTKIMTLLMEAVPLVKKDELGWHKDVRKILKDQKDIKIEHENRIFNNKNKHEDPTVIEVEVQEITTEKLENTINIKNQVIDPITVGKLNSQEAKFGEMTEEELAELFNERPKKKKGGVDLSDEDPFKGMTKAQTEEWINDWEEKQNNSNDIYKVKARVNNLAVGISGKGLTDTGVALVNAFTHVLRDLYKHAESLPKEQKVLLIEKIRKHESFPGTFISAASVVVKGNS